MKVGTSTVVPIAVVRGVIAAGTRLGEFLVSTPIAEVPPGQPTPPLAPPAPALESRGDGAWSCAVPCVLVMPLIDSMTGQEVHLRMQFILTALGQPNQVRVQFQMLTPSGEPIDPGNTPIAVGAPRLEPPHIVEQ